MPKDKRSTRDEGGETLVEAVVAMAVLAVFFMAFATAVRGAQAAQRRADTRYAAETEMLSALYAADSTVAQITGSNALSFSTADGCPAFSLPALAYQQVTLHADGHAYTVHRYVETEPAP